MRVEQIQSLLQDISTEIYCVDDQESDSDLSIEDVKVSDHESNSEQDFSDNESDLETSWGDSTFYVGKDN